MVEWVESLEICRLCRVGLDERTKAQIFLILVNILYVTFLFPCSPHPKVYNVMQKVQEELYSTPEDASDFLLTLQSEPGMFVERTFDDAGRLVNVFWVTVQQQEKMARFGGCIQLDTTIFTNRFRA